ncbi:glycosyltransferase family 2 protein [uncultured Flavobacterium sp.]|uniref:glycosyltransferase family 2 protein n=1 Tax=uncultured Flavobacterium sp. TaxID=165435 RepID=UPI0030EC8C39|tara:strand:+ start:215786 stop:216781 length:996 start_codon:yes stop_codon:yes gene_type:complete
MNKIAVVILNWNGEKLLQQFLPSIIQYSENASIYVADNASTDTSIAILKRDFPTVKVIQNKENYGFAKGYNEALKFVEEPYYALVNSDIEVTANWLNSIIELFDKETKTAIIQPKILDFKKKSHFEYAGAAGGFIDKYGYPFCKGRIFDTIEEDKGQYDDKTEIFWASGACFFIRKEVYHELEGFDADFFAHQEEIDLCWRAFNLGYIAKYTSKSLVYHVGGATLDVANPRKTFLNFRNSLFMLVKNLPLNQFIQVLFIRMILDGIAAFKFLFQGKPNHFLAVGKAHFYFYLKFNIFFSKRKSSLKANYFKLNSIVMAYFIKKQKTFLELF